MGHSHLYDLMGRRSGQILAFKYNTSGFWGKNSCESLQSSGLAGTIGTDQCNNLTLVNLKRNPLQCLDHAIIHLEILYFQHCH